MPGIIGFVDRPDASRDHLEMLKAMATALASEQKATLHADHPFSVGHVGLGIIDSDPQPVWNHDGSLCMVMEGELYGSEPLKRELAGRGYTFQRHDDAELVLHLFEEYGEGFVERLNGAFVFAIWNQETETLLMANDRLGLQPLYYAQYRGRFSFASGVRALLADPDLPRVVDRLGIAQFLTFDHLLDQRTFLETVHLLPQATILTYHDGEVNLSRYWELRFPAAYALRSEEEWMDAVMHCLRQAVRRQTADENILGLLLSGGLDSRLLMALMRELHPDRLYHTFTFGIAKCDDARFAREVAAALDTEHHFFPLRPDWLLQYSNDCVRLTDGMANLVNLHARAALDDEVQFAQILFKGFLGDAMFGFAQRHQHWATYDETTRIEAHLAVHRSQGVLIFDFPEHEKLFTDSFRRELGDSVLDSYRQGLDAARTDGLADQRIYYDYCQRVPRHTLNGVTVTRRRAAVRLPFADNDLVELALSMPPGLRYHRRVVVNAFIRDFSELAKIPVPNTGLPMMECARDVVLRARQLARWHLNRAGLKWIDYPGRRPYKDYDAWFRTVLRDWVEKTLLDQRALGRGYFNPDYVQRIVHEHMAGSNHTVRLGVLLSLELWHRQFMD